MVVQRKQTSAGFTLIELLVVIAIIGLLSSVILGSLATARKKGRDARRIADLKQLQVALELFYSEQSTPAYPAALSSLTPTYIAAVPTDPKTGSAYTFSRSTDTFYYCMGASMEGVPLPVSSCNTSYSGLSTPSGNYIVGP